MENGRFPDFLVIGAPKCGTTALWKALDAPTRTAHLIPHAKLVVVLRNPVERAFSHWVYYRMKGIEKCDTLEEAMSMEPERLQKGWRLGWGYRLLGLYGQQLERWLGFFPRENLLVVFYEDWLQNPVHTLNAICSHIGAMGGGTIQVPRENQSFVPRSARLQRIIMGDNLLRSFARRFLPVWMRDAIMWPMLALNLGRKTTLDPQCKNRLAAEFEREIRLVETLT